MIEIDTAALNAAWESSWPRCPPVAQMLKHQFVRRWVRFDSLSNSKRYATSEAEYAEILHRYRTLVGALMLHGTPDHTALVAVTCSWSATSQPTPRDIRVAELSPQAAYWRSDNLATEPGFQSWQHHYACATHLDDPTLDKLLLLVANDQTDGVIVTDPSCTWAFHPYDGGADVFVKSSEERAHLERIYSDWLTPSRTDS